MIALNLDKLLEGDTKFREDDTRALIIDRKLKKLFTTRSRLGFKKYPLLSREQIADILTKNGLVTENSSADYAVSEVLVCAYGYLPFIDGSFAWRFRRLKNSDNREAFQVENFYSPSCY